MIMTENTNSGCSQRDSAEHEGYAKASRSLNLIWKERDSAQSKLMEAILYKDNLNRADKDVSTRILCEHGSKLPKRTLVLCESDNS